MKIADLVKAFASREKVPVDVDLHVVPLVNEANDVEIYFFGVDMDTEVTRGNMSHWEWAEPDTGKVHHCLDIHHANSLSSDWARLVCCKELIHLCDPIEARVMTEAGLDRLINKIILPPSMQSVDDGDGVLNDRRGIMHALAVLFPWACRELLMQPYLDEKITIDQIAEMVDIPVEYAAVVMDEIWQAYHHFIST